MYVNWTHVADRDQTRNAVKFNQRTGISGCDTVTLRISRRFEGTYSTAKQPWVRSVGLFDSEDEKTVFYRNVRISTPTTQCNIPENTAVETSRLAQVAIA
jgi:hypothetical protein